MPGELDVGGRSAQQGFLASFLGGIGRADLALAAKEAAPLSRHRPRSGPIIGQAASQVLAAPKLRAEPTEVNLGVVPLAAIAISS